MYNYLKACRRVRLCDSRRVGICIFYSLFAQRAVNYYYGTSGELCICSYCVSYVYTPLTVGGKSNGRQMPLNKLINKGSAGVRQNTLIEKKISNFCKCI